MDVTILVTPQQQQEEFWRQKLPNAFVVTEDWKGGAGNGLGTLYAFQKAEEQYGVDLIAKLKEGASIAMYHSSGQGKRLFPLVGSEHNNKSAVKLPVANGSSCLTILEAVMKQTALYGNSRKGRLSVFWGDQVFIPSRAPEKILDHHVDVLATVRPMPSKSEWEKKGLSRYGLVAIASNGDAQLLEKQSYEQVMQLLEKGAIQTAGGVGTSLGSFSVSWQMLQGLLGEFKAELSRKEGKLDSDPHFWMPLTLDRETYVEALKEDPHASHHHDRMQRFKESLLSQYPDKRLFRASDVGTRTRWWDYGSVAGYFQNSMKLAEEGDEADMMRAFYEIAVLPPHNELGDVDTDETSVLFNCRIKSGKIRNSVLANVTADIVDADGSVLVDVQAKKIHASHALGYHVRDDGVQLGSSDVRADAQHYKMFTKIDRDGKKDWEQVLEGNEISYKDLYKLNN